MTEALRKKNSTPFRGGSVNRGSAKFNCPYRGRRTYSERGLRFHIRLYHPEKVEVKVNISIARARDQSPPRG
jgi:hypothetical protein